jgi:dTDP-glucose 4,6-dehydratase
MVSKLIDLVKADCEEALASSVSQLEKLKNQKIFITGGTGFVGTWLAEITAFLNDRYHFNTSLLLLSRNIDAYREKAPHLAARKDMELIPMDVRNIVEIPSDVTYIIHAAATPDNRQHVSDPLGVMATITKGTSVLLDSSVKLPGLKKILNISSGQIYGKQGQGSEAIKETFMGAIDCNTITSVYPEAKRYAEALCCAYWSLYKVPAVIARPFAFIGPYQFLDKPWAINNFIRDALNNNTIRIIGNGLPMRSYMYPSDMAFWLLRLLAEGNPGTAYNVGSPEGISLKDLAEKIKQFVGAKSKIDIKNMNEDRSRIIPDVTLCRESLGLTVKVGIDKTLQRSILWFQETGRTR